MAKKQFKSSPETTSAAAAVTKSKASQATKTPRVTAARHSRGQEVSPVVAVEGKPAVVDQQEIEQILTQPANVEADLSAEAEKASILEPKVGSPVDAPGASSQTEDSRAAIEKLAYSYYEARGYSYGDPLADWVRAEREFGSKKS